MSYSWIYIDKFSAPYALRAYDPFTHKHLCLQKRQRVRFLQLLGRALVIAVARCCC